MTRLFFPLKSKPKHRRIATFDTEGNGQYDGFVCASVISDHGIYFFTDRKSTLEYLLSPQLRDHWIFAHNLEYDLGVLTGGDLRRFRCLFTQRGIIFADVTDDNGHVWRFCDSTNIFVGASIKQLGELAGQDKMDLEPIYDSWLRAGLPFYQMSEAGQQKVRAYCVRDTEILYNALTGLQEELLSLGGSLKYTAAGCAMDLFRRKFMRRAWPVLDPDLNRLARQAYYGARSEPYRLGRIPGVNGFDISSLYPSIMAVDQFPWPGSLHFDLHPPDKIHIIEREGISQATVFIPELDPSPLPVRYGSRLFFPNGHVTGAWTHSELRNALEAGCHLQSIDWTLWSGTTYSPFGQFINKLYKLKALSASDSPLREHFFKQLMNSSYGRFGLNPDSGLFELIAITDNKQFDNLVGSTLHWINDAPYALRPIENEQLPPYANSIIAAHIIAGARVKMFDWIGQTIEHLCYTDTDSLWLTGQIETKKGLGEMRQTHADLDLWVVAPKEYAVFSGEALVEAHAKGIPEQYRLDYLAKGEARFDRPVKIREASRRHTAPSTWLEMVKRRQYQFPKRAPMSPSSSSVDYFPTKPWLMEELHFHLGGESGRHHFRGRV